MHLFQYSMPKDTAEAIRLSAQLKTQQGADVRFIAGGTTLLDLMKLNVEQPNRLEQLARTVRQRRRDAGTRNIGCDDHRDIDGRRRVRRRRSSPRTRRR